MLGSNQNIKDNQQPKLHILFATEYLPPYVSGIANRCKNLINGYRQKGHRVTVYSVSGTDCDVIVPSIMNPFYAQQRLLAPLLYRTFCLPPFGLMKELLDFSEPPPYDVIHVVAPLCFSFIWALPLLKLRGVKIYVSYHVYLECKPYLTFQDYFKKYFTESKLALAIAEFFLVMLYFLPLVFLADCIGIPSKVADGCVYRWAKKIHILKSGLDTTVFNPKPSRSFQKSTEESRSSPPSPIHLIETKHADTDDLIKNIKDFSGDNKVMVYVGRLAPEKNIEFLINSLSHHLLENFSLLIVGDGPSRDTLHNLANTVVGFENVFSINEFTGFDHTKFIDTRSSPILAKDRDSTYSGSFSSESDNGLGEVEDTLKKRAKRVIFTGMILDEYQVANFYTQSDVFVSASESETFGFTVAEAMACGIPAVVVKGGAFPLVFHEVHDWMFDPLSIEQFVERILAVSSESRFGIRAREVAERGFGVNACLDDFIRTYTSLILSDKKRRKDKNV